MNTREMAERITLGLIESAKNHVKRLREDPQEIGVDKQQYSADLIEELVDDYEKLLRDYLDQQWIPVSERVPDNGIEFDAWNVNGFRIANHGPFHGSIDEDFKREVMRLNGITHWKIPQPPESE